MSEDLSKKSVSNDGNPDDFQGQMDKLRINFEKAVVELENVHKSLKLNFECAILKLQKRFEAQKKLTQSSPSSESNRAMAKAADPNAGVRTEAMEEVMESYGRGSKSNRKRKMLESDVEQSSEKRWKSQLADDNKADKGNAPAAKKIKDPNCLKIGNLYKDISDMYKLL